MTEIIVGKVSELQPGQAKKIEANGKELALYNVEGIFYATQNACMHKGGPLCDGTLEADMITCPWHGWKFGVRDGVSPVNPEAKIETYPVTIDGEDIKVTVPDEGAVVTETAEPAAKPEAPTAEETTPTEETA